jgi:hypothetical protein
MQNNMEVSQKLKIGLGALLKWWSTHLAGTRPFKFQYHQRIKIIIELPYDPALSLLSIYCMKS